MVVEHSGYNLIYKHIINIYNFWTLYTWPKYTAKTLSFSIYIG